MSDEELQEVKEGKVEVKGASEAEGERERGRRSSSGTFPGECVT